jgi:hypothetical protein
MVPMVCSSRSSPARRVRIAGQNCHVLLDVVHANTPPHQITPLVICIHRLKPKETHKDDDNAPSSCPDVHVVLPSLRKRLGGLRVLGSCRCAHAVLLQSLGMNHSSEDL